MTRVYLSQLMLETGKLVDAHPGYQAAEIAVPAVGAAVATDAVRAEKMREASMTLVIKNVGGRQGRPGLGKGGRGGYWYIYGLAETVAGGSPSLRRVSHAAQARRPHHGIAHRGSEVLVPYAAEMSLSRRLQKSVEEFQRLYS